MVKNPEKTGEKIAAQDLVRCKVSKAAELQLKRDYINFERSYPKTFENKFLCRILENYLRYVRTHFKKKFEDEIKRYLEIPNKHENRTEIAKPTVTKSLETEIANFSFINHRCFKKSAMITYILERYAELDLSTREKIYTYQTYRTISDSIKESRNNNMLLITTSGKEYEVRPYKLIKDDNTFFHYLIG